MTEQREGIFGVSESGVVPESSLVMTERAVSVALPVENSFFRESVGTRVRQMSAGGSGGFQPTIVPRVRKEKGLIARGLSAVANVAGDIAVAGMDLLTWIPVKWARATVMKPIELWQSGQKGKAIVAGVAQAVAYYFFPPLGLVTLGMLAISPFAAYWKRQLRGSDIRYLPEPQRAQMESEIEERRFL
jgi:hypothetical protein